MHINHICATWVTIVGLTSPVLFPGSLANAQTAACCLGDQCQELEQAPCEDGGGLWLGDRPSPPGPIMECAGLSCPAPPNDDCQNFTVICENLTVDPDAGWCNNVDLMDPGPICSLAQQDCYDGSTCVDWPFDAHRCRVPTDNRLSTTDGPLAGNCFPPGDMSFGADVWSQVKAPCDGQMTISMCNAELGYDSMLGVYSNGTSGPASCPPGTDDLRMCDDDFCPGSGVGSGLGLGVATDAIYIIRVGGWSPEPTGESAAEGVSELDIGFLCDTSPMPPGLPDNPEHLAPKNRYITIDATTNEWFEVAYEVTLASMRRCSGDDRRACIVDTDCPNVCDNNHDLQCTDDAICSGGTCVPTAPCIEHADVGNVVKYVDTPFSRTCSPLDDCADQRFANLRNTPVFRVWTEDTLHITACEIVPAALYEVRAELSGGDKSVPLMIGTILKPNVHYADCVGPMVADRFTPPDGFTSVLDVQAYLIANQGGATAPHTTWVDIHGVSPTRICDPPDGGCVVPQQILGVSDLQTIKFGFIGQTYVETPGHENPGDCP